MKESFKSNHEYERSPDEEDFSGLYKENPTAMVERTTPAETGLMLAEQEKTIEKSDIDDVKYESDRVKAIGIATRQLEEGILVGGFQEAVNEYGADKFFDALLRTSAEAPHGRGYGGQLTADALYRELIPGKKERNDFYDRVTSSDVNGTLQRLHELNGGAVSKNWDDQETVKRYQRINTFGAKTKGGYEVPIADQQSMDMADNGDGLFKLMIEEPEIFTTARETGDLVQLVSDLADIYGDDAVKLNERVESVQGKFTQELHEKQRPVNELQEFSETAIAEQVQLLEDKLESVDTESRQAEFLRKQLDDLASATEKQREEYKQEKQAIEDQISEQFGILPSQFKYLYAGELEVHPLAGGEKWDWDAKLAGAA
jgi:hypothetical protein